MTDHVPLNDDQTAQAARLQQFLNWLLPVTFAFVALLTIAFIALRQRPLAIAGTVLLVFGLLLILVQVWLRRGHVERVVATICTGLFVAILLFKLTEPVSPATLAVAPLLAVAIALPYVRRELLRRLMLGAWLLALVVSLLNEVAAPVAGLPVWVSVAFRAGSFAVVVALLLLLLWQFNSRLSGLLAQLQAANAALGESEARYRTVSEMTSDMIYSYRAIPNGEFELEWATGPFTRLTGYAAEDLGVPGAWRALLGGLPLESGETTVIETPFRTKSGDTRWARNYARYERDSQNRLVRILHAAQDITESKRAEEDRQNLERKLLEIQKLESLAVLAGGIAHDFNNILAVILGNADLARMELPPDSPVQELLAPIAGAVQRATGLTQQMLAYSGRGHFLLERHDISVLVLDLQEPIRTAVGDHITMIYQLAPALPSIDVDPSQIRQLVLNLAINAAESIGQTSGHVTISTGLRYTDNMYLEQAYLALDVPEGQYVFLEVADTGSGMDEATLARIFEPFFTTKFMGRGLGLAAVVGIVRGHHGTIRVQSTPGQGTRVMVLLPINGQPPLAVAGSSPELPETL